MKKICTFKLFKNEVVEEAVIKKDEAGTEIKVLEKVDKKVPFTFFIKKPGREIVSNLELYTNKIYSACIKNGILSAVQLQRHLIDSGGILSESQIKERADLYENLFKLQAELKEINEIKLDENKELAKNKLDEIVIVYNKIQYFENQIPDLYQHTAETISKNKSALWLALHLSYTEKDGKEVPVFGEGSFEDKLKKYDTIEDSDDEFQNEVAQKMLLAVSMWYFGKCETQEDFDLLLKINDNKSLLDAAPLINDLNKDKTEETKSP